MYEYCVSFLRIYILGTWCAYYSMSFSSSYILGIVYNSDIDSYSAKISPNLSTIDINDAKMNNMRLDNEIKNNNNNFVEKVIVSVEEKRVSNNVADVEYDVVVAVDIGTTYSGYAFAYTRNQSDKQIHMMRQTEGI